MNKETAFMLSRLQSLGISWDDALALRKVAMTLHRWHEKECGDSNDYSSWCITRGKKEIRTGQHAGGHGNHMVFVHDENGKPFLETHYNDGTVLYTAIADKEKGAHKRLAAIMAKYPALTAYIQGDPRGASLYILRPGDVPEGEDVSSYYSRGIAVYK